MGVVGMPTKTKLALHSEDVGHAGTSDVTGPHCDIRVLGLGSRCLEAGLPGSNTMMTQAQQALNSAP